MIISPTNRKFLIAYALLVGLPLLGLVGVLKAGRGLTAPVSVDGKWKFAAEAANPADAPCAKSISSIQDSWLTISQSGKGLVLSLEAVSKASSTGAIEGTTVSAALPQPDGISDAGCGLAMVATVDAKAEPRSMLGTISVSGCPSCAPVKWHAVRQARPAGKGTR